MRKNKCRYNKGGSLLENRKWYTLHATDIAELLSTHLSKGLSSEVARQRLEEQGYNELVSKKRVDFLKCF